MSEARKAKIENVVDDFLAKAYERFGLSSLNRSPESDKAFDRLRNAIEFCAEGNAKIDDVMRMAAAFIGEMKTNASRGLIQPEPHHHGQSV